MSGKNCISIYSLFSTSLFVLFLMYWVKKKKKKHVQVFSRWKKLKEVWLHSSIIVDTTLFAKAGKVTGVQKRGDEE